jgi:hypothetical protein
MIDQGCGICENTTHEGLDSGQKRNGCYRCTITGCTVHQTEGGQCTVFKSSTACNKCQHLEQEPLRCGTTGLSVKPGDGKRCRVFVRQEGL